MWTKLWLSSINNVMGSRRFYWFRIFIAVFLVLFFLIYITRYRKFMAENENLSIQYDRLIVHSNGLSAQLQLMVERNQRTELMIEEMKEKFKSVIEEHAKRRRNIEMENLVCEENLKKLDQLNTHLTMKNANIEKNHPSLMKNSHLKIEDLSAQLVNETCQKELNDLKIKMDEAKKNFENTKIDLDKCNNLLVRKATEPVPKKYVENGKVLFDRLSGLNEVLEFRRDNKPPYEKNALINQKWIKKTKKEREEDAAAVKKIDYHKLENGAEVVEGGVENEEGDRDYKIYGMN